MKREQDHNTAADSKTKNFSAPAPLLRHGLLAGVFIAALFGTVCTTEVHTDRSDRDLLIYEVMASTLASTPFVAVYPAAGSVSVGGSANRTFSYSPGCTGTTGNTSYWFAVKPGSTTKVLLYFADGGICYDAKNCFGNFTKTYYHTHDFYTPWFIDLEKPGGIFAQTTDSALNPLSDWTIIYMPNCSADGFIGSNPSASYTNGTTGVTATLKHSGFDNFLSALDYLQDNYAGATQVLVASEGTGLFGSIVGYPYVKEFYSSADVNMLQTSFVGVLDSSTATSIRATYTASTAIPTWIFADESTFFANSIPGMINTIAATYPTQRFALYSTAYDAEQAYIYSLSLDTATTAYVDLPGLWGSPDLVSDARLCTFNSSAASLLNNNTSQSNFHYYFAPGETHEILGESYYTTMSSNGTAFPTWIQQFLNKDAAWTSVGCTDCGVPLSNFTGTTLQCN